MAWIKLYDDILGDPKLMRAARKGLKGLELLPWLIAFACKARDNGRLSVGSEAAEPEDIAEQVPGADAAQVADGMGSLEAIGVLIADADGCLRFAKWEPRQSKPSATKSAVRERVQRHRETKRRNAKGGNTSPALQGVTGGAEEAQPTPRAEGVTPCNATEVEVEEKRREKKSSAPAVAGWVAEGVQDWESIAGAVSPGELGKSLKSMVVLHGWPAVRPDMQKWLRERIAAGRPCKPAWYAGEVTARLGARPKIRNDDGTLTDYGERITRPGLVSA